VAIRGGGHNIAGNATCDGGLVIDLTHMKSVRVEPSRHTARAEPGVTWREFDHATQTFGLATTAARSPPRALLASPSAAAGAIWRESMAWPATIFSRSMSSQPTASSLRPAQMRTRIYSGACGVAAETMAL
jgi:hypothetical protein